MGHDEDDVVRRIESLDLGLFDPISSQSSPGDKQAWLAVQRSIRQAAAGYVYLEIGSHLGGSIQQHLVDPACRRIVSIDKRPPSQPDDRGEVFFYEGNSTERMLENLRRVAPEGLGKVVCYDADASALGRDEVPEPPQFCFIDGEHTKAAVLSDFEFCLKVCDPDAAICFHDATIIFPAIESILESLRARQVPFAALKLTGDTFGVFLRNCRVGGDPYVSRHSEDGPGWLRKRRAVTRLKRIVPTWLTPIARRVSHRVLGIPQKL